MDDVALHLTLGIDRSYGLYQTLQTIHTEQIYIQNTPAFEIIEYIQPGFTAFMFADPYIKNIFFSHPW